MLVPFSEKWNPLFHINLSNYVKHLIRRKAINTSNIPNATTMPTPPALRIGAAKRMNAAIMFFDFEDFTKITSHISL